MLVVTAGSEPPGAVGVLGARGGAGATTLSALLARGFSRRGRTVLVQAGTGAAIDIILGTEHVDGLRWPDLAEARGRVDPGQLAGALRRWRRCAVLTTDDDRPGPIPAQVEGDVLTALRRGHDTVLIDLDRWALSQHRTSPALDHCDRLVLLVPRDIPAVAGARLLLAHLPRQMRAGVVTRRPAPGGLGGPEVAAALDLPWWSDLPGGRALSASVDAGAGPVPGMRAARRLRRVMRELA